MNKLKAVIFDVDGLMLNTEFLWQEAWCAVGKEYGMEKFGDIFHRTVGLTGKAVNDIIDEELGDFPKKEEILAVARQKGMVHVENHVDVMLGVRELLDLLDEKGITKAVATTTDRNKTEKRLSKLGLLDRFSVIVCGDEVKNRKPDPEIYLTVAQKLGIPKENILVLEDTGYGVRAAYQAGLHVIMVPSINPPGEEEKKMAYRVVSSLHDVIDLLKG